MIIEITGEQAAWLEGKASKNGQTLNQLFGALIEKERIKAEGKDFKLEPAHGLLGEIYHLGSEENREEIDSQKLKTKKKGKK